MPKITIEIHQRDLSGCGLFEVWYFDRYANRRCEIKTDADIYGMLAPRQLEQFDTGEKYRFSVSGHMLIGC